MTKIQQFIFLLVFSFSLAGKAQDIHFSQYSFTPSLLSPALSQNFNSEFRGGAVYRNQWASVPVNYTTFLGYFDKKIHTSWAGNSLAYGMHFQFDQAGDAGLSWMQLQFNGVISRPISPMVTMALGVGLGYGSRQFKPEKLSFGHQFTDQYRPNLPSGENFTQTSAGFSDFSIGLHTHVQNHQLYKADMGVSWSHLNHPKISFLGEDISLLPSIQIYGLGQVSLSEKTDVLANAVYRLQNPYSEWVISSGLKYYLNKETNQNLAVSILAGMRWGDAFFPEFHVYYKNWNGGLSYDINHSDFKVATAGKGGVEFSIQYIANQIVPPKKTKICPIF